LQGTPKKELTLTLISSSTSDIFITDSAELGLVGLNGLEFVSIFGVDLLDGLTTEDYVSLSLRLPERY
jgi:hypothetical protein